MPHPYLGSEQGHSWSSRQSHRETVGEVMVLAAWGGSIIVILRVSP